MYLHRSADVHINVNSYTYTLPYNVHPGKVEKVVTR